MSISIEQLVPSLRSQFPALARREGGKPAVFLDGPAGTQVPQAVIDAMSHYLSHCSANHGGLFPTGRESDALLDEVHRGLADFVGADDPDEIVFGQNMTSLTFAFSRALARTWKPGDEIVVTLLDHDANVTPWVLAARDAGIKVQYVRFRSEDCTLDVDDFRSKINSRTRLVAVGCASNATGGLNPVRQIADWGHQAGALVFADAVHFAPHGLVDVKGLGVDFLACSAYKFFGPHIGILWGKRQLMELLEAYKVRPASNALPSKWMTGTQSHESMAGALAAVEYLAGIGRSLANDSSLPRRQALGKAYESIVPYERSLVAKLLKGLAEMPEIKVFGITDSSRLSERVATVSFTHSRFTSAQLAERLGSRGIFAWHGNYYALNLSEQLGNEPHGMLRVGLVHYNTGEEVERLLTELRQL
ncbi:MAG: cysteine desulfurase-like protein [Planctomycetales bacterium]|nr:cysteine desulfurase-like protein [Planctomycetales bacterium]